MSTFFFNELYYFFVVRMCTSFGQTVELNQCGPAFSSDFFFIEIPKRYIPSLSPSFFPLLRFPFALEANVARDDRVASPPLKTASYNTGA